MKAFLLSCVVCTTSFLYSQQFEIKAVEVYDLYDGISSNMAFDIFKDEQGFIWIATVQGINRFDGKSFKAYRSTEENGLTTDVMRAIYVDHDQQIWAGSKDQGLFRLKYNEEQYQRYQHDPQDDHSLTNDQILTLIEDSQGRLWVGTEDGLNLYRPNSDDFIRFFFEIDGTPLERNPVISIYEDRNERIWVGLWGGGLFLLEDSSPDPVDYSFQSIALENNDDNNRGNIWGIVQDDNNRLWISSFHGGLFVSEELTDFNINSGIKFTPVTRNSPIILTEVFKMVVHNNQLYLGASNGLCKVDLNNPKNYIEPDYVPISSYEEEQSFSNNEIRDLLIDDSEIIWAATFGGLGKIDISPPKIKTIPSVWNNRENYVFDIINHRSGQYLATNNGLFLIKEDGKVENFALNNPSANVVVGMYKYDNSDTIYLATKDGLYSFDIKSSKYTLHEIGTRRSNTSNAIRKIIATENSDVVFLCTIEGLVKLRLPGEVVDFIGSDPTDSTSLSSDQVVDALIKGDLMYVATLGGGLNIVDLTGEKMKVIAQLNNISTNENAISENLLTSVAADKTSELIWIGSDYGLIQFDPLNRSFEKIPEISSSRISGLLTDSLGRVWYTSPEGIFCYSPTERRMSTVAVKDGSLSNKYVYSSYTETPDGQLFFGGLGAYNLFYPDQVLFSKISEEILLANLSIAGENKFLADYVSEKESQEGKNLKQINLRHDDYMIKLDFTVLDYHNIETIIYSYRVQGFNEKWIESKTGRLEFSSFPSGAYTLEIKAKNLDGFWTKTSTIDINVSPPLYKSDWFLVFLCCIALGMLYGYARRRINKVREGQEELKSVVLKGTNQLDFLNSKKENTSTTQFIEQVLNDNEAFYTQLFMESPLGILITDEKANVLRANKRSQEFIDLLGLFTDSVEIYSHIENLDDLLPQLNKIKESFNKDLDYVREDIELVFKGNKFWFDCAISVIRDANNKVKNAIISIDDISDRKMQETTINDLLDELEIRNSGLENTIAQRNKKLKEANKELKSKNEELERFAFIASHDLKEPVRNINSYLSLIKMKMSGQISDDIEVYFNKVFDSTSFMYELISDVLEYSRINKEEHKIDNVNLMDVMDRIKIMIDKNLEDRNAILSYSQLPSINTNSSFLSIVIKNIIENGIKFNKSKNPIIAVTTKETENFFQILISDNGIGIPEEYRSQIFEMFQRLHNKSEFAGSGLGLSICKRIMERLGGDIHVESKEGKGSTFILSLPKISKPNQDFLE